MPRTAVVAHTRLAIRYVEVLRSDSEPSGVCGCRFCRCHPNNSLCAGPADQVESDTVGGPKLGGRRPVGPAAGGGTAEVRDGWVRRVSGVGQCSELCARGCHQVGDRVSCAVQAPAALGRFGQDHPGPVGQTWDRRPRQRRSIVSRAPTARCLSRSSSLPFGEHLDPDIVACRRRRWRWPPRAFVDEGSGVLADHRRCPAPDHLLHRRQAKAVASGDHRFEGFVIWALTAHGRDIISARPSAELLGFETIGRVTWRRLHDEPRSRPATATTPTAAVDHRGRRQRGAAVDWTLLTVILVVVTALAFDYTNVASTDSANAMATAVATKAFRSTG